MHHERVSRYNRLDAVAKLANAVLLLTKITILWYEHHEKTLATWERSVDDLKQFFGDPTAKRIQAEQIQAQNVHGGCGRDRYPHIMAVVKLCKTVSNKIAEEDKVGRLLKGIAEDVCGPLQISS